MTEKTFSERFSYNPREDLLGSGGFGSVYRAFDKEDKRFVAIKISQVKDLFGKFTLLNEVDLSKKIDDHPNVARYEFGLRVMHPFPVDYAVMAYYEDGNLDQVLKKSRNVLQPSEYKDIIEGLLLGIGHLHTENVIHRDLKLANILMSKTKQGQWRPKIADFGLSRETDNLDVSVSNSAIGLTMAYAAPEQIENKTIRKNVDFWAFGVIVYRLMTGEMPFTAPANMDLSTANLHISKKILESETPEKLHEIREPYRSIVKRCLLKDAGERVQTAEELLALIRQQPGDRNTEPRPDITRISTVKPESKRKLSKVALMSVGAAAFIGVGFFSWQAVSGSEGKTPMTEILQTFDKTKNDDDKFIKAQKTGSVVAYENYLTEFPMGKNSAAATDSIKILGERFNKLLNDSDVFISIEDFAAARTLLKNAVVINPENSTVLKKLETINKK